MSEVTDCKPSADSASRKRCPSPGQDEGSAIPLKSSKVSDGVVAIQATTESCKNSESENKVASQVEPKEVANEGDASQKEQGSDSSSVQPANPSTADSNNASNPLTSDTQTPSDSKGEAEKTAGSDQRSLPPQSDSAAIAAAEALASLTGGDGEDSQETPCSSEKVKHVKHGSKYKQRGGHQSSKAGSKTQAAAADSSTSVRSTDKEAGDDVPEADEGDESGSGSSSTPSSSFPSDNEDNDDGECAIVSVKMAPEMRQSVALLAQVQMRLEALEKKSARLHQRLEQKINRQRRPHLDQRSSITKTIPGFWVTAVSFK